MQSIHIKVSSRNTIRRFAIADTNLGALRQQVAKLFALENSETLWTLKYKDEENELITIDRDDELEFAVKLMGKLLHLVVVEHVVEQVCPTIEFKGRCNSHKFEKRHGRGHHHRDEEWGNGRGHHHRDDEECSGEEKKRDKHVCRNRLVCLQRKENKLRDRLASLQGAENPKAQARATKISQKLAFITAEIATINAAEASNTASNTAIVPARQTTAPVATIPSAPIDAKIKEVYNNFFAMRRDLVTEKKKIDALVEVLRALRALSKHGEKVKCTVKVDDEQVALAQNTLVVARQDFVAKKLEVQQQGQLVRELKKQGHKPPKQEFSEEEQAERKSWNEGKAEKMKAKMEEKERKREAKQKWQEEKAKVREEKLKKQEEKAKFREEKAAQRELKAMKWKEAKQQKEAAAAPCVNAPDS